MRIGSVGSVQFQPYIYKASQLDRASMDKVHGISDDLTSSKTDFSGLTNTGEGNANPLRRGESLNLNDIIESQMQSGRYNADRIISYADDSGVDAAPEDVSVEDIAEEAVQSQGGMEEPVQDMDQTRITAEAGHVSDVTPEVSITDIVQGVSEGTKADSDNQNSDTNPLLQISDMFTSFRMRRAADAYAFSMGL